jgi:hypothetical protein
MGTVPSSSSPPSCKYPPHFSLQHPGLCPRVSPSRAQAAPHSFCACLLAWSAARRRPHRSTTGAQANARDAPTGAEDSSNASPRSCRAAVSSGRHRSLSRTAGACERAARRLARCAACGGIGTGGSIGARRRQGRCAAAAVRGDGGALRPCPTSFTAAAAAAAARRMRGGGRQVLCGTTRFADGRVFVYGGCGPSGAPCGGGETQLRAGTTGHRRAGTNPGGPEPERTGWPTCPPADGRPRAIAAPKDVAASPGSGGRAV